MKIAITGGAGFIGSEMVRQLVQTSAEITVIDSLTYAGNLAALSEVRGRVQFEKIDIRDKEKVKNLFKNSDFDSVVNFAAETHVDNSIISPSIFLETNVLGTLNLLEAARIHNFRFVQISTDEVYGSAKVGEFHEDDKLNPSSPYSASKASAELLIQSYIKTYAIQALGVRCSNNYGPFQNREKLIPAFINKILEGQNVPIYGNGLNVREWIHVSDSVSAIIKVLNNGKVGEFYNVSSGEYRTNLEVAGLILEYFKFDSNRIDYVTDRLGHDFRYAISSSKIRSELNWEPIMNFEIGLISTIEWYLAHREFLTGGEIFNGGN